MFATFASTPNSLPQDRLNGTPSQSSARLKRSQVVRACDWCRIHRIKCDSKYPCTNCQNRGGQCSNENPSGVRTLPQALRWVSHAVARSATELTSDQRNRKTKVTDQRLRGSARGWQQILQECYRVTSKPSALLCCVIVCRSRPIERAERKEKVLGRNSYKYCTVKSNSMLRPSLCILFHRSNEFVSGQSVWAIVFRPSDATKLG